MGRKPKIITDENFIKPYDPRDMKEVNKRIKQRVENWDHERNRSKTTGEKS